MIGNGCGYTSGFEDYKYLYWPVMDPTALGIVGYTDITNLLDKTVCVKACPTTASDAQDASVCKPNKVVTTCHGNV